MSKSPKYPDEDLFESTKMSFGEHIEELRATLIRSLFGVLLGILVGFYVGGWVVDWIKSPLEKALASFYEDKAITDLEARYGEVPLEMETVVRERHVAPEEINVDPVTLAQKLRQYDPLTFGKLSFEPYRFVPDDLKSDQAATFCQRLVQEAQVEGSHGQAIWNLLSKDEQAEITRLAESPDEAESPHGRMAVAQVLNRVAGQPALHQSPAYEDLNFLDPNHIPKTAHNKPYTTAEELRQSLAGAGADDAETTRRLNRLLISYSYPAQLRSPQMSLVTMTNWKPIIIHVQTLSAHEAFSIYMKAAFITGFVLAGPWIFIQIWNFVGAGLYPHEKRYVHLYLPMSLLLFVGGAALAFFFVFAPVLQFLFAFNKSMNINPDPRISEWLGFVLILPLGFGIGFQLPLVMLFLHRVGVFSVQTYLAKWRMSILTIFIVSMVLTPADPVSMLFMAVPLTILYFGGIALCQWMPRGRNPFTEAYEP